MVCAELEIDQDNYRNPSIGKLWIQSLVRRRNRVRQAVQGTAGEGLSIQPAVSSKTMPQAANGI